MHQDGDDFLISLYVYLGMSGLMISFIAAHTCFMFRSCMFMSVKPYVGVCSKLRGRYSLKNLSLRYIKFSKLRSIMSLRKGSADHDVSLPLNVIILIHLYMYCTHLIKIIFTF